MKWKTEDCFDAGNPLSNQRAINARQKIVHQLFGDLWKEEASIFKFMVTEWQEKFFELRGFSELETTITIPLRFLAQNV